MLLLVKRPEEGLLAGLWEFPTVLLDEEVMDVGTRRKIVDKYLKELFHTDLKEICNVILRENVGKYVHIFSHIRLHMHVELLILKLKGTDLLSLRNNDLVHCIPVGSKSSLLI